MDLNKFFSYFNSSSDIEVLQKNLDNFKESPIYKIKIFERLITNGLLFKKSIVNFFDQADKDLDIVQIDLAGEFMIYTRAWFWINQLDWDDEQWVKDLEMASNENFLIVVKSCMNYFERQEEYEKCAFLKKIQDFVQNYLAIKN